MRKNIWEFEGNRSYNISKVLDGEKIVDEIVFHYYENYKEEEREKDNSIVLDTYILKNDYIEHFLKFNKRIKYYEKQGIVFFLTF